MDSDDSDDGAGAGLPGVALVALLGGCVLLVIAAIVAPHLLANVSRLAMIGGGAALGLLLWMVALPLGLRHAGAVWKLGGLALLVAAGAVAGLMASRTSSATGLRDASSFAEAEITPVGAIVLPRGVGARGPVSLAYADALAEAARDRDAHGAEVGAFDLGTLNSPYLLARAPAILSRCGDIASLKARAAHFADREAARGARLGAAIDAAALPADLRTAMRTMAVPEAGTAMLAQDQAALDVVEERCRLMARRGWRDEGGYFAFGSAADRALFDSLRDRSQAIADEQGKLARAKRERMVRGQEAVRELLSR